MLNIQKDLVKSITSYRSEPSHHVEEKEVTHETVVKSEERKPEVSSEVVQETVAKLNDMYENQSVSFSFNDKLNRVIIKIHDDETDEIIKEFPSKEIISIYEHIQANMGLIIDESR